MPTDDPLVLYYDQWDMAHRARASTLPGRMTTQPCPRCGVLVRTAVRDEPVHDLDLHLLCCPDVSVPEEA